MSDSFFSPMNDRNRSIRFHTEHSVHQCFSVYTVIENRITRQQYQTIQNNVF
jgi:hypothetical protein